MKVVTFKGVRFKLFNECDKWAHHFTEESESKLEQHYAIEKGNLVKLKRYNEKPYSSVVIGFPHFPNWISKAPEKSPVLTKADLDRVFERYN
jgi:hypothetical protein